MGLVTNTELINIIIINIESRYSVKLVNIYIVMNIRTILAY